MKVTIEMENLQKIIEESAKINTEKAIDEAIHDVAHEKVNQVLRNKIEEIVNSRISEYVDDYLKNTKIHIGGGWDRKEVEEYTAEEYLKKQIKDIFESQSFVVKYKDRWGDWREEKKTFQEYIDSQFNAESIVKPYIEKMAKQIKDEVNSKVKSTFNDAMRTTLADNVFTIIASSETYRTITQNMKLLGE